MAALAGHRLPILSLAVSPDGAWLASGEGDIGGPPGVVKLWDFRRRLEVASLPLHDQGAPTLAFAPHAPVLATASWSGTIRLWDIASRDLLLVLNTHTSGVPRIAYSPDGSLLASVSNDGTAKLWDPTTGKERATLHGHTGVVQALAIVPDGKTVASGSGDQTVRLWDVPMQANRLVLPAGSAVHCVSFSPNGQVLLSGHTEDRDGRPQGVLKFWNVATGALIDAIPVHELQVGNAVFSPDGKRLLTSSWDRTAKIWDVNSSWRGWSSHRHTPGE